VSRARALPSRDAIVATARESIVKGSRSFAAASRLFARPTRERAWLLYAWCRACDDLADGQVSGHGMRVLDDAPARLVRLRAMTEAALRGDWVGDPAFDALRIVATETGLPHHMAHDLIAGFQMDADDWRPTSEDDLIRYCYHVAGVVGCMMAVVMGVDPGDDATLDRACDLGIAFQLANIARDLGEDAGVGRCYLPTDWLSDHGLTTATLMDPANRPALAELGNRLATRAAAFEASARFGTPALDFRAAWAVLAAAGIYGAIGREVARRGAAAWNRRVTTSAWEKLGWIAQSAHQAWRRRSLYAATPRDPALWQRPRR
jgi:phytoene synthase